MRDTQLTCTLLTTAHHAPYYCNTHTCSFLHSIRMRPPWWKTSTLDPYFSPVVTVVMLCMVVFLEPPVFILLLSTYWFAGDSGRKSTLSSLHDTHRTLLTAHHPPTVLCSHESSFLTFDSHVTAVVANVHTRSLFLSCGNCCDAAVYGRVS